MHTNENDLTTKPIFSSITLFALPMLLGNMLQQLYNIVDTWVVGRYIGTDALASVGAVFALMVFLTSVLLGLCMGSGAVFSQCYGAGDNEVLERRVGTAFIGIAGISVLITIIAYLARNAIIQWLNIPVELQAMTKEYMCIVFAGIPAVFLYNFFAGYLKSIGDSRKPLLFLGIAAVSNICLDLLFVLSFHMGIGGAAWATIISQYLSGALAAGYCIRYDVHIQGAFGIKSSTNFLESNMIHENFLESQMTQGSFAESPTIQESQSTSKHFDIRMEDIRILGSYSLFTCLQQSVMNLGILMVQGIVNSFGAQVMAAFSAGVKIDAFAYMPAQEYGNAFSTFLAQNHGAGKEDRVKTGTRVGVLTTSIYSLIASLILYFLSEPLMKIFVDAGEMEIISIGVGYLHIEGMFYIGIGILFLWYGYYRALGRPQMSLVLTVISLGTRVALSLVAAHSAIGVTGIWWSIPIGWALADLVGLIVYLHSNKKTMEFEGTV